MKGKVHMWIKDILSDRYKQVNINGVKSSQVRVTIWISQGSVLRPVLFTLYINDLPSHEQSQVRLFANDEKVFTQNDDNNAQSIVEEDLYRLHQWSNDWQLHFQPEKCSILRFRIAQADNKNCMTSMNARGLYNRTCWEQSTERCKCTGRH